MSKLLADKVYRMQDENGNIIVSFVISSAHTRSGIMAVEELKTAAQIEIEAKPYKSKRSLEQNALMWVLLDKLSVAMFGKKDKESVEETYICMLEQANVKADYMLALPEAETMLKKTFRVVKKVDTRDVNGKRLNMYKYFLGSSKFSTAEMTEMIENILDKLAELGICDSEIEQARCEFGK